MKDNVNNKKKLLPVHWVLMAAGIIVVAVLAYLAITKFRKSSRSKEKTTDNTPDSPSVEKTSYTDSEISARDVDASAQRDQEQYFPLKKGVNTALATESYVNKLQQVCNYYGAASIKVPTHYWGSATEAGMLKLQTLKETDSMGLVMPLFPSITRKDGGACVPSIEAYDLIVDQWQQDSASGTRKNVLK